MEPHDVGGSGGAARNHANLRQQQEEFRRRLMRPDRVSRGSEVHAGDPIRTQGPDAAELLTPANVGGTRPDPNSEWAGAFQTPQVTRGGSEDTERIDDPFGQENDATALDDEGLENDEAQGEGDDEGHDGVPQFDPSAMGLKEISNLASFTVSSSKPGCGVKELRDDDVNQFWQSDGPQPHRLNIHFIKRVEIRVLRLYLDYELDESYTPTKLQINAGFSPNQTIPYTTMELNIPKGWIDVPIAGAGGGLDGNSLCCWFVRVTVLENHQNGKDTHIRGIKVYALDDTTDTAENNPVEEMEELIDNMHDRLTEMKIHDHDEEGMARLIARKQKRLANAKKYPPGQGGFTVPDFMREPEIR